MRILNRPFVCFGPETADINPPRLFINCLTPTRLEEESLISVKLALVGSYRFVAVLNVDGAQVTPPPCPSVRRTRRS